MKRLILMRHAKADEHFIGSDLSCPLTKDGVDTQKKLANYLKEQLIEIDAILYSPYKRAEESAFIIFENYPSSTLLKEPALGTVFDSYTILRNLEQKAFNNVMVIGHSPTLSAFALSLLKEPQPLEFDKSKIVILDFENKFEFGGGDLVSALSAKNLLIES